MPGLRTAGNTRESPAPSSNQTSTSLVKLCLCSVLCAPCSCLRRHPSSPAPSPTSIIHFSICRRTLLRPQAPAAATPAIDKTACRLVPAGCNSHTPLSRLDSACFGLSPIEEREPISFLAYTWLNPPSIHQLQNVARGPHIPGLAPE